MAIDEALDQIEAQLQEEGQRVLSAVHGAIRALEERDVELADEVIAFDDEIDQLFLGIEGSVQSLLALQTPVARDLRLLLAILHINLLLERTGDGCVTVAKLSKMVADVEPDPPSSTSSSRWASEPRRCAASRWIRSRAATSRVRRASSPWTSSSTAPTGGSSSVSST